jgi:hypothetical protein
MLHPGAAAEVIRQSHIAAQGFDKFLKRKLRPDPDK